MLPLAERFLRQFSAPAGTPAAPLSEAAREALLRARLAGQRARAGEPRPARDAGRGRRRAHPEDLGLGRAALPAAGVDSVRGPGRDERRRIEQVLLETGGSVSRAADRLGLSRQALYRRMEKLGISLERRPRS